MADVAIIGTGYVGLTTGAFLSHVGHRVVCADIDPRKIEMLSRGEMPIFEPGLDALVRGSIDAGRLRFVLGAAKAATDAEFVFLCVQTPQGEDGSADLSYIEAAAAEISPVLRSDTVVINKSTVPVGSTLVVERALGRSDVKVVSNPEFLREGNAVHDCFHPDRIVIGSEDHGAAIRVASLYESVKAPQLITDPASAETIKYASNAFLATKISFVNAIANVCEAVGADVREVVLGMGYDKRIGFEFLHPGPGWGGSCFPKDTHALVRIAEDSGYDFDLLRGVITVNEEQKVRIVQKVVRAVGGSVAGKTVAVWGLTFKARTDDRRSSPSLDIAARLADMGATVRAYDPTVTEDLPGMTVCADPYGACEGAAVVAVLTEWDEFRWLDFGKARSVMAEPNLVDARNLLDPAAVRRKGFTYTGVGQDLMRVVVTGAAGFLGSHLSQLLVERGDEVVGIDNLVTGRLANLEAIDGDPRFTFVAHDVSNPFFVDGDVDGIVHMASPASPKDFPEMPIKILKVGGLGSYHCCGMAKAKGARLVVASTSEVYGDPLVHPQREDYFGNVNTLGERGCYDEAKRFAEAMVVAYNRHHGLDVGIVRTFNTHGPRMRADDGRVVSTFCVQALSGLPLTVYGDGSQTRSLCYVDDQVRGYVAMLDHRGTLGPVNVGTPGELTVLRIAEFVIELTGSSSEIVHLPAKPDDPARREPVIDRARDLLGWEPEVDVVEGLTRTIDWFRGELAGPAASR